jgi:hypothetical protein
MAASLTSLIQTLLPLLRTFVRGEYGIALGGAHAKGVDDAESDVDLYVFARQVLPVPDRDRLCQAFSENIREITSWSDGSGLDGEPFVQGGTDFYYQGQKVEIWFRGLEYISGVIADCQAGSIRRDLVTWTVMGFFNYCTLSDLYQMAPVDEPQGVLARWKTEVSAYPPAMKQQIIQEYLSAAKFWPENFHYRTAITRCDILYTTGIVQQVVHNLIQVVFALNEVYFPGEKKLEIALDHLTVKPRDFTRRVQALVFPAARPTHELLESQRRELVALVSEIGIMWAMENGSSDLAENKQSITDN